ncbi:hypothetical protein LTR17_002570 [Elasticomyces elasticus]|nr:hypothetical protein LTR17_002570 [Elasticomyces elasticus]
MYQPLHSVAKHISLSTRALALDRATVRVFEAEFQTTMATPLRIVRAASRTTRFTTLPQRRYLDTATAPSLYSAHCKVVGARTGHVEGDDLNIDLTMSKALGGPGERGKTNPEELFAAGYGACFQSAMNATAASMGLKMPERKEDSIVESTVHLVGDMKKLDLGLRVDLVVKVKGMKKEDVEKIVEKTKTVCPYSRATAGNVATSIEVEVS